MAISNLGHRVRVDGRGHRHDHCLHYGRYYCRCWWCQRVGQMMIFPLEWIDFLLLRHGGVTYEKGNTRVPHCELTEGVASPLPRPMQQLDQACSVRWLNWVKPQGFKAMHGLASGMMIMPRSTKASRQIHEAVVTAEKASIITAIFSHQLHHSWGRMDPTSPSWSSGPTEQLLQRPETQNEA